MGLNPESLKFLEKRAVLLLFLLLSAQLLIAQEACYWPCFHGPNRTNKSAETGLLNTWPGGGPELIWATGGLGKGYSTVSFSDGVILTSGMIDRQTYVFAMDLEGKLLWKRPNGASWQTEMPWARTYDGSRSTPTCDGGIVYHLGELGRLVALELNTGEELWHKELRDAFDAEIPEYGYSESVLIEGNRLFCCPAGKDAYIVCLDKNTGEVIWMNNEVPGNAGFGSLISFDIGGIHMLAGLSSSSIFSVDAETGRFLWSVPFENSRSNNIADPVYSDGYLFASSGYGRGSILLEIKVTQDLVTAAPLWETDLLDNHHGGVILHEGCLYGAGDNARGWFCLDFKTGLPLWKSGGKGSLTYAEGMLYCLDERGIMTLVSASPGAYLAHGSFRVPKGGEGMYWAHPVICHRRLYIRHDEKLFVYDLNEK